MNSFAIFKNKEKTKDTQPDYKMSINIGTKEQPKYVECAGIWMKEGQTGKFMSGLMSKPFGERAGYEIVEIKGVDNVPKFDRDSQGKPVGEKVAPEIKAEDIPW